MVMTDLSKVFGDYTLCKFTLTIRQNSKNLHVLVRQYSLTYISDRLLKIYLIAGYEHSISTMLSKDFARPDYILQLVLLSKQRIARTNVIDTCFPNYVNVF